MTTGQELRDFLAQARLTQKEAGFILDGVNERTVRGWCGAPNKRFQTVPEWVIPRLSEAMGISQHPVLDKFVIGHELSRDNSQIYILHTQKPRFCCLVSPMDKPVKPDEGPQYACGNRLFHHFMFFDQTIDHMIMPVVEHVSEIMNSKNMLMY